jgi:1-acylglycerone phosphate reductase
MNNYMRIKLHNIEAFALELDDRESIERLKELVTARTNGQLYFLVNNAGIHYAATAMDLELEKVVKLFHVNVFAVMHLCQIFIPLLSRSPHGSIVQIGSVTR